LVGLSSVWIDSVTGLLSCISNTSSNCLAISGAPGGSNGALQFNNSSVLGGSPFIFDGSQTIAGNGTGQTLKVDNIYAGTGCPNDTGTGTTQNKLAKLAAGKCVILTTSDIGIPAYLIVAGAGTSGSSFPAAAGIFF
jgi:hypothetical protein